MKTEFNIKSRAKSFRFAFQGISELFKYEPNIWIHSVISITVIIFGLILNINLYEWGLIALSIGLVLTAEALNSAIEKLMDKISPGHDPQAGKIKDMAAAGVLFAAIAAAVIGLIIFIPKIIDLL